MRKNKIGYIAHNAENELIIIELLSMLRNDVFPDFVIFQQNRYKRWLTGMKNKLSALNKQERREVGQALKKCSVYNFADLGSDKARALLTRNPDSIIVCNGGLISWRIVSAFPGIIFLNKHCSKLPEFRGVNNIEWALWERKAIYASIIRIHHGIDEGDILWQEPIDISTVRPYNTAGIRNHCFRAVCKMTGPALHNFTNGKKDLIPQENKGEYMMQYYSMHYILKDILERRLEKQCNSEQ